MGQTLSHGVYLPAEGERNCYSGLASNWNLLDTAIGDTAGKASATHTHGNITNDGKVGTTANLPLITGTGGAVQAGSFGNAANTFCEGNDSRLSDARTPVAHTHIKSDVTDLLNSNFIPSANNSYDLGSSGKQWNNLYAKNYYYNGTAWGLDQNNTWTGNNQYNNSVRFNGQVGINWARGGTTGTLPSATMYYGFQNALDSNDNVFDRIRSYVSTAGTNLQEHIKYAWNDLTKYAVIDYWINSDGSDSEYKLSVKRVIPSSSNETDLGNSTHKWKSFNGINPGSLSFPSGGTTENTDWFNVAGSILPTGGNVTDLTGGPNFFTPSKDGWLCLVVKDCSYISVWDGFSRMGQSLYAPDTTKNQQIILPVLANHLLEIRVIGSSWYSARLFMPKGNI